MRATAGSLALELSALAPSRFCGRKAFQQPIRFSKPGPFTPPQVSRHGRLFGQDSLRPLPRLDIALLRREEAGVVVVSLRQGRNLGNFLKQSFSFRRLVSVGVGPSQQSGCTMKIVLWLSRHYAFEIRHGRGEVAHLDRRNSATIEGIG